MSSEFEEFDFQTYPWCGAAFDMHLDHYWDFELKYRTNRRFTFKCHSCHTVYGVAPVITSYQAKVLEKGSHG